MDAAGRKFTSKQMGDACEMLVAAELTLAGIPALKVPDSWPGYDVVAQPLNMEPQRISVKSRTYKKGAAFVEYHAEDQFDWLAIVIIGSVIEMTREIYVVPRKFCDSDARRDNVTAKTASLRYWRIDEVSRRLGAFKSNFQLKNDILNQ